MITWINALYEIFHNSASWSNPERSPKSAYISINPSNSTRDMNMSYAILSATQHGQS